MQGEDQVRSYFQKKAVRFDAIYTSKKGLFQKIVDRLFRQVIRDRFDLTFLEIREIKGRSVLDVGCGSGRYALEFARRGADKVLGIDYAQTMIDIAKKYTENEKQQAKCEFVCGNFINHDFREQFDYTIAMGFFDYLKTPSAYLTKMKKITSSKIVASFPKRWTVRTIIRKIRLFLAGCPVYFYSRGKIEELLKDSNILKYKIFDLSRDFILIADIDRRD